MCSKRCWTKSSTAGRTLRHRTSDEDIALGHRRLSIIDVSEAGTQPLYSEDGNLVLVFNGEIYNYQEIRARLMEKG